MNTPVISSSGGLLSDSHAFEVKPPRLSQILRSLTPEDQLKELIAQGLVVVALGYAKDILKRDLSKGELRDLVEAYQPEIGQGILLAAEKVSPEFAHEILIKLQSKFSCP